MFICSNCRVHKRFFLFFQRLLFLINVEWTVRKSEVMPNLLGSRDLGHGPFLDFLRQFLGRVLETCCLRYLIENIYI